MNMKKKRDGSTLTIMIPGRMDTSTSPEIGDEIKQDLDGISNLVLDFKNVNYVSSAGLRVLLSLQNRMAEQGEMKLINVNEAVCDVFEVTGFDEILTYEKGE